MSLRLHIPEPPREFRRRHRKEPRNSVVLAWAYDRNIVTEQEILDLIPLGIRLDDSADFVEKRASQPGWLDRFLQEADA